jgi:hypothetical protein
MSTGSTRTKFSVATEAVDTFTRIATRYADRVDLSFVGEGVTRSSSRQGKKALIAAQELILRSHAQGVGSFGHHLNATLRARPGLVIAVSDWRDPMDLEAIRRCTEQVEAIIVRISDPHERELPDVGLLTVEDPESGRQLLLDTSDTRLRERFAQRAAELDERFRDATRQSVLTLELTTSSAHGGRQVLQQILTKTRGRR